MTPWTVSHQALLSMKLSRQEYWIGMLFLSPGDLQSPGNEPWSSALQADSLPSELPGSPLNPIILLAAIASVVNSITYVDIRPKSFHQNSILSHSHKWTFSNLHIHSVILFGDWSHILFSKISCPV